MSPRLQPTPPPPQRHRVGFYLDDDQLVERVVAFAVEGLAADEVVMIVATADHRQRIAALICQQGINIAAARAEHRYVEADAAETLTALTDGTGLSRSKFMTVIGGRLATAGASWRPVRAFGEMVALLWEAGDVAGAIELEGMWNELAQSAEFTLECAYPLSCFTDASDVEALCRICDQHSAVDAPASCALTQGIVELSEITVVSELFFPHASAVAAVRRFTDGALRDWSADAVELEVSLVVSELATNAISHAGTPFLVTLERDASSFVVSFYDGSDSVPVRRAPDSEVAHGRGIALVERLATTWGTEVRDGGKVIRAEFALGGA